MRLPRFIAALLLLPVLLMACNTLAPEPVITPGEKAPETIVEAPAAAVSPLAAGTEVFPFSQVSGGWAHTCGLKQDGSVVCWGYSGDGRATPPSGSFSQVSAGESHTCGLKPDGSVVCWGHNGDGQTTAPSGSFSQVSAGVNHTCGIKPDGSVACWGYNYSGQATPPSGSFSQVSAGIHHTCGLKPDGSVACWGYSGDGRATPPSGSFSQVSAGVYHTCGLKKDGSVVCWGHNGYGQTNVPSGSFSQVSAGEHHTCGLKPDGSIVCWGYNGHGLDNVPSGSFSQVSAALYHTCGIKPDGSIVCWGNNGYGQANAPTVPILTGQPSNQTVAVGGAFSLSVTATGTTPLSYQWRRDGTNIEGATSGTYTVNTATVDRAGSYDVVVTNVAGRATSETATVNVTKAAQVLTFAESTLKTAERGSSVTLEVTSTSTTPIVLMSTTTSICTVSGFEVSFIAVGACTVTAEQAATAIYNAGSASHEIQVVRTLTDTVLSNVSGSGTYGGSATLDATLKTAGGDPLSSKTVAFTVAGTDVGNAVTDDSGIATLAGVSLTGKDAGDYEVTASFAGDDDAALAASDGAGTLTVAKATQSITFTSSAPTDPRTGTSYTVSATATSELGVTFSATPSSVCSISGNTVSFENPGTCTVAADQGGSTNYEAAPQQTQSITVVPADTTPPVIVPTISGTLGSNEWYTSNITVNWSVTDAESAVSTSSGCGLSTISADTAGTTLTCSAISAGGDSSESITLKRDATPPTLAPTVSATQVLLNGSVTATPNASDSTSGLASQSCAEAATNSVGNKSISCTASDNAGNSASASVDYSVVYGFSGFSQPVNNDAPNKAKAGQAIPLKWRLTDAAGLPVTTLTEVKLTVANLSCSFDTVPGEVEEYAPGSSGLQNLGDGYYQFNWKTPTTYANSCKTLQLSLGDELLRTAAFQFMK